MFEVFANCPEDLGPEDIGQRAARAEAMGYDGMMVPDAIHDGLLLSALALRETRRLIVGTGVLVAFPRSPMITAIAAWDLQKMSGGRFELGLGTQIKQNIEQRYSARWDSPVPQLREYIQAIKAAFGSFQTGARLNFEGEHFKLTRLQPFFNPGPITPPAPPILAGAVGPAMTKMVGRIADGMITHPTSTAPEYVREVCLPRLQYGFDGAGRDAAEFKLLLGPLTATGRDEAVVDAEWEKQRELLGFLFSTPAYWASLQLFGWEDKGPLLLEMARDGKWEHLRTIVTDEILEAFVPRGTYEDIADDYKTRFGDLTRRVTFPMPENPHDDEYAAAVVRQLKLS